jgi:hypothetical protein
VKFGTFDEPEEFTDGFVLIYNHDKIYRLDVVRGKRDSENQKEPS